MHKKCVLSTLLVLAAAFSGQALAQTGFDIKLKCFVFDYRDGELITDAEVKITAAGKAGESRRVGNFYLSTVSLEKKPSEPIRVSIVPPAGFVGREIQLNLKVDETTGMSPELWVYLVRTDFVVTEEALLKAARQLDYGQFGKALALLEFAHIQAQNDELLSWLSIFRTYRYAGALQYMCREREYVTCEQAERLYQSLETLYNSPASRDLFRRAGVGVDKIQREKKHIAKHLAERQEKEMVAEFQVAVQTQLRAERCREAVEIYSRIWDDYDKHAEIWKKNGIRKWTVAIDLGKSSLTYAEYLRDRPEQSSPHEIYEYVTRGVFFLNRGVQLMGQRPVDSGAIDQGSRIEESLRQIDYDFDPEKRARWKLSNLEHQGFLRVELPKRLDKGQEDNVIGEILNLESERTSSEEPARNSECLQEFERIPVTEKMELNIVSSSKLTFTDLTAKEQQIPALWRWKIEAKEPGDAQPMLMRTAHVRIGDKDKRQVLQKVDVDPIPLRVRVNTPVVDWAIWQILGALGTVIGVVVAILAYFRPRSSKGPSVQADGAPPAKPHADTPQGEQKPSQSRGARS